MSTNTGGNAVVAHLIGSAADALNKPAPLDAPTGKVYIPDARLVMPPYTDAMGSIEYFYDNSGGLPASSPVVHLTSSVIMNMAKNKLWIAMANNNSVGAPSAHEHDELGMFQEVPSLQACARGVQLYFSPQSRKQPALALQDSHQLRDGRTVYVYSEPACKQDQSAVIALAKQSQSY